MLATVQTIRSIKEHFPPVIVSNWMYSKKRKNKTRKWDKAV